MLLKSSDLLPLLMQTQQKGTVHLVDSVTERQQSSDSPPKPLTLTRKSEISLMEKSPQSFRTVCIPRLTSVKWVPAFFCSKHSKIDPFSRFSVFFSLSLCISPVHMITNGYGPDKEEPFLKQPCFFLNSHDITIKRQELRFLPLDGYLCFYRAFVFISAAISGGNGMTIARNPVRLLRTSDAYSWV